VGSTVREGGRPVGIWILRSLLFVPGTRPEFIAKARQLTPDAIILDLEDSVIPPEKPRARQIVAKALEEGFPGQQGVFVRINGVSSGVIDLDLRDGFRPRANGIVLPKCESPAEIHAVDARLRIVEERHALPRGSVRLLALIESARGVLEAPAIARSHPRIWGIAFGGEDYTADLGVPRTGEGGEVAHARAALSLAAHAASVEAVDGVYAAFTDERGLRADAAEARRLGYTGKLVLHPSQIGPVHEIFAPTPEEVQHARRVVAAFADAQARGEGVAVVDDMMVDRPVAVRAERVLAVAARSSAGEGDA
jgi:citrate lyase subunit beta / citryl-CoA lyase